MNNQLQFLRPLKTTSLLRPISRSQISTRRLLYSTNSGINSGSDQNIGKPIDLRSQLPYSAIPIPNLEANQQKTYPPHPPNKTKRSFRPYIYSILFFLAGSMAGKLVSAVLTPPPPPEPGTPQDQIMVKYLHEEAEKLPVVKLLSSDPQWTNFTPYRKNSVEDNARRLTTGPLAGSRGLGGYQRVFRNSETGEIVNIVWFGGALSGWPGVTHGGLLATVMDETLGRCASSFLEGRIGVTAHLELNYVKPALTNSFYVIRALPMMEGNDAEKKSHARKKWVSGKIESVDGVTCVEGKALFVVPKKYEIKL